MTSNKDWLRNVVDVEITKLPRDFAYCVPSQLTETSSSEREFTFNSALGGSQMSYAIRVDAAGNVALETRDVDDVDFPQHYEPGSSLESRPIGKVASLGNEDVGRLLIELYAPFVERGRKELGRG